jgi:signal transduction histidine kinase
VSEIVPTLQDYSLRALLAAVALGLLVLFYRWRVAQVTARLKAQIKVRQAERERIARALHDTLLQGVQSLTLRFQTAVNQLPADSPVRANMEALLDSADQIVVAGRDQVMDLRASMEFGDSLADTLNTVGHQMAQEYGVGFRFSVEGRARDAHPLVADEIYCIAREALSNAFRHGGAAQVEVTMSFGRTQFVLRIADNGCGIDDQTLACGGRRGHWGLAGMRERAQALGGTLEIWSGSGKGTEIVLTAPAAVIYTDEGRPYWHALLHRSKG